MIVVDEIGSPAEAAAVRGIAQRGVVMVGTAHGTDLSSLMANPDLNSLIGGIHQVTLSDAEAKWVLHLQCLFPMCSVIMLTHHLFSHIGHVEM